MRFYKLCALLGTLIIVFDIGLSLMRIQSFESIVTEVFESIVKTQMEIDGLQQDRVISGFILRKRNWIWLV